MEAMQNSVVAALKRVPLKPGPKGTGTTILVSYQFPRVSNEIVIEHESKPSQLRHTRNGYQS